MPRKYTRKVGAPPRAEWSEENLKAAMDAMLKGVLSDNEISRRHGIPLRTLRRRFVTQNTEKKTLGKHPMLSFENERRLVMHIKKLEKAGFTLSRGMVRRLAFEFAEKLGVETTFDKHTRKAGPQWLQSFLERNAELNIPLADGLSERLSRDRMFDILLNVITEYDLFDKPDAIQNADTKSDKQADL